MSLMSFFLWVPARYHSMFLLDVSFPLLLGDGYHDVWSSYLMMKDSSPDGDSS